MPPIPSMIYARVTRALESVPGHLDDNSQYQQFVISLNREFKIFGVRVTGQELNGSASVPNVSRVILDKIAWE